MSERTCTVSVSRYGYHIDGQFYRRVTTNLKGIPKPWLGGWAAKQVAAAAIENIAQLTSLNGDAAEAVPYLLNNRRVPTGIESREQVKALYDTLKGAPWAKRDDAGDRGTAVHEAIEAFIKDEPLPDSLTNEDELKCAIAVETWLQDVSPTVLGTELTVYNQSLGYAGTLDLWCVIDGQEWLIDWKTSRDVYVEHAVQQVAYSRAEYVITEKVSKGKDKWEGAVNKWGPDPGLRLGIVHVTPEAAALHPIDPGVTDHLWRVYRAASFIKQFLSDTDSYGGKTPKCSVFLEPVTTGV